VKISGLILLILLLAFNHAVKAQTVTNPWASMGGATTPSLIAIDASNNLYVTNFSNSTISKITPAGTVTQAWATLAANTYPYGIAIDASGNLYTANRGPKTISKITPSGDGSSGTVIQTWANLGGDEAYTLAIDATGIVYVPYVSRNRIAKITPNGATGTVNTAWVTLASGANPFSISFDAAGNLYSANSNNTISKITPAGVVTQAWATLAASSNPQFMVFDPSGNLYVSCWGTSKVAKINSSGTVTDNWSLGTNVWTAGIVLDGAGNVYTTNHNNHTISKITPSGTVTQAYVTLANGANPFHLVKDASGNLYTTNMGNHTLSKISCLTPTITVTGDGCANKTTLTVPSGATAYAWYKDNVAISGATSNSYIPTAAGAYLVQVTTGSCTSTSAATTIYSCGRTASGQMEVLENSSVLVSKDGAINNGKGVDSRGSILSKPWAYGTVTTRTGRIWLDRNLGATRVAQSSTDVQAYGDYYQWGRPADGHEKQIVSGSASDFTNVKSANSVPGNSKYIFPSDGSFDWLITPDNTLWTGVNAPNNPCPAGFRIPTESEWAAEAAVFTSNNVDGSFEPGYGLRLTVGGMATSQNYITAIGNYGQYLTQTAYSDGRVKYFGVISWVTWFDTNYYKTTGQSIRCIKD
jgi:uncharacterized protein (TIGR02145 family)